MNSLKSEESKLEQNLRLVIWALLKQRLEMEREFITVQTFRVFSFIFFAKLNSLPKSLTVERAWRRRKIQKEKFQKTRTQRNNTRTHVVYFDQPKAAPQTISWLKSTISVILYFFRQMQGKTKKKLTYLLTVHEPQYTREKKVSCLLGRLMCCGTSAVGINAPQFESFYTVPKMSWSNVPRVSYTN